MSGQVRDCRRKCFQIEALPVYQVALKEEQKGSVAASDRLRKGRLAKIGESDFFTLFAGQV